MEIRLANLEILFGSRRPGGRILGSAMTDPARSASEVDAYRAADRLRHDLGKGIRLSAPDTLETDAEALRARLRADVLETRRSLTGSCSAVEIFALWHRDASALFPGRTDPGSQVTAIAGLMGQIAALAAKLDTLDRPALEGLDRLTRDIARECRALAEATRPKARNA
jgi:hypothetical protein